MVAAFSLLFCNSIDLFNRTCKCTRLNGCSKALLVIEMLLLRVKTTNDDVAVLCATYLFTHCDLASIFDIIIITSAAAATAASAAAATTAADADPVLLLLLMLLYLSPLPPPPLLLHLLFLILGEQSEVILNNFK